MLRILYIGFGGFLGATSRYFVSGVVHRFLEDSWFPYGTFAVNMLGCFLIGFLNGLAETRQVFSPDFRMFMFIGFLGSFTTFSTFDYEVFEFVRDGQFFNAFGDIALQVFVGLGLVWGGNIFARLF